MMMKIIMIIKGEDSMKQYRFKRLLCGMLAAAMAISVAACSAKDDSLTKDTSSSVTTAAEATPETSYLDTLPKEDFNGYEFRIIAQSYNERPNLPEDYENGDLLNDALYRRNVLVEETYGVKIVNNALEDRVELKKLVRLESGEDIQNLFMMTPYYYKTGIEDQQKINNLDFLETQAEFEIRVYRKEK